MMDADGDGFPAGADCDDNDPHIFPGAPDFCGDGKAQNCIADTPCATDGDGDHYNAVDDCDDANPAVRPWATELCNGRDDDCEGLTDEGHPDALGVPMVANSQAMHCTGSDVGACATPVGDCVCSASAIAMQHFQYTPINGKSRTACPGETQEIDTGMKAS